MRSPAVYGADVTADHPVLPVPDVFRYTIPVSVLNHKLPTGAVTAPSGLPLPLERVVVVLK